MLDSLRITRDLEAIRERALFLRDEGLAAIADLHLGYEGMLQSEGVSIPRRQKAFMLETLERLIERCSPETLLVNGDFKHSFSRNLDEEWLEVKDVLKFLMDRVRLVVVRGNHDNYLASILHDMDIDLRRSYRAGRFTFAHGHLDIKTRGSVVIGHEHPALKLRDDIGATLSLPAFVIGGDIIILPAFSPLAIGADVASQPFLSPILRNRSIDSAKVLGVDDREGIMDFGTIADIRHRYVSLLMK